MRSVWIGVAVPSSMVSVRIDIFSMNLEQIVCIGLAPAGTAPTGAVRLVQHNTSVAFRKQLLCTGAAGIASGDQEPAIRSIRPAGLERLDAQVHVLYAGGFRGLRQGRRIAPSMEYDIEAHKHAFAAWAASRAAAVGCCRFKVEAGKALLEACGFDCHFSTPEMLPEPLKIDECHRGWRELITGYSRDARGHNARGELTHGVAAKLINCYLKMRFVCGGHHAHERVSCLHPPVDGLVLTGFAQSISGAAPADAAKLRQVRWSTLTSNQYEDLIGIIKSHCGDKPLWHIEMHWPGHR